MKLLSGKTVFGGIAIGRIKVYKKSESAVKREHKENSEGEIKRFREASKIAICELQELYNKSLKTVGEENALIFEIHQMMLNDLDYVESIEHIIMTQKVNAEYAVATTADNFAEMFQNMDDAYMQARALDVKDVSEGLIEILIGKEKNTDNLLTEPCIILADDLTPSETVQLDKDKILGFVTMYGSSNSHTAILARTMNIPAIVGVNEELNLEFDGKEAILDGYKGILYIEPSEDIYQQMKERQMKDIEYFQLIQDLKGKDNITKSGKKINIFANIGNLSDLGYVIKNDAGGIGLFRSEFLYLENNDYPTEEQQFEVYKTIVENMGGKKVIIRTLDIGADKKIHYFNLDHEENPAMGYRAIRICLTRKEIFKTQLRAIYRASYFGNISIMFPMIISHNEILQIKQIIQEVKEELTTQGILFNNKVEMGVMIETPAAVMISECLAKEVDFFSIGTNDLTQYTLAIDRQNNKLDAFYDAHHPAILKMIKMVIDNAHAEGKWVGICGELGADLSMTKQFIDMGIDELSVAPSAVLPLRKLVREFE